MISRVVRLSLIVGCIVFSGIALVRVSATPQRGGPQGLKVHELKPGRIYWVEGGGGNSGVIIGQNGVVVIDAKMTAEAGKQLIEEVAKLTPKPITTVIETHSDGDHINGLVSFPTGLNIIAHENNMNEQLSTFLFAAVEVDGGKCLPPIDHLPNEIIRKEKVSTKIEGINFVIYHFAPAHTNGDLVIYLPDDKIVFTGDIITNIVYIHPEKNGTVDGWFTNVKGLLGLDAQTYVGGHASDTDTKASLQKMMADVQAMRDKVDGLEKDGKSLAEIKAAMNDRPKDLVGCRGIPYPSFAETEYHQEYDKLHELK